MNKFLGNLSIRAKLLYGYSCAFILALAVGSLLLYLNMRGTIEESIEQELTTSTQSILNLITTSADASIRNHLRAVAEKNQEIAAHFFRRSLSGEMSEEQAKKEAARILLSQTIGTTGYVYVINSEGLIQAHPQKDLAGADLSRYRFIQLQKIRKEGYLEYDWANPDELDSRPKALYMTYFKPWDWIIAASSYRDEFSQLFDLEDIKPSVLSITFGQTGYPYIIDIRGLLLVHPKLEGTNIYNSTDSSGRKFIKLITEQKNGKIIYPWQNPGEPEPREKLVIFNYIPEFDWIVASSSYLEEFYEPLETLAYTTAAMASLLILLLLPVTWWISTSISRPVLELINGFKKGADGDFSVRLQAKTTDEVGQLAEYYNQFMAQLENSRKSLQVSAENYRGLFENAVEGIYQTTAEGQMLSANPSMAHILGYDDPDELIFTASEDTAAAFYVNPEDRAIMIAQLEETGMIIGYEVQMRRKDGATIWASLNARGTKDTSGKLELVEGFITDVTQRHEAEDSLRKAKQELEQRVEERTKELTNYVNRLKLRNEERTALQEMIGLVQLCQTPNETYPVVERFMDSFFPEDEVDLFIHDPEAGELRSVFQSSTHAPLIEDECWGLRQGKPYLIGNKGKRPSCAHMETRPEHGSLCVPLSAHNELIGMLHVQFQKPAEKRGKKLRLASSIADHLSLAFANLNLRESLRLQSIQDPLTGLFNRRYLDEALSRELARARRKKRNFAVMMIDLDHFKQFNDNYGHDVGDLVLKGLADHLRRNTRAEDIPCRFGGEEFALVINEVTENTALAKAENICRGIREQLRIPHNGGELRVTASIGVAVFPIHGDSEEALVKAADEALYRAKEQGRDQAASAD